MSGAAAAGRFLFVLWDGGGNVAPVLLLVHKLTQRGHSVGVLSNPSLGDQIEAAGGAFLPFRHAPPHDPRTIETDALRVWDAATPAAVSTLIRDRLLFGPAPGFARDTTEAIGFFSPHVVAADYVLFGALAAAEAAELPVAVVMDSIYPLPQVGKRRLGPFTVAFERMIAPGLGTLNDLRRRLGVATLSSVADQYRRATRVLVMTYRGFDEPSAALPAEVRHVGPQFEFPQAAAPEGPPRVLVSFSTVHQGQAALLRRLVPALAASSWRALVTAGPSYGDVRGFQSDRVEVVEFAPHERVMPGSAVVMTHGGHGTTIRALAHGVPLLCVPYAQDQFDNASRVEELGAGLRISHAAPTENLLASLGRLLEEPAWRSASLAARELLHAEHRPLAAVEELEELLPLHTSR